MADTRALLRSYRVVRTIEQEAADQAVRLGRQLIELGVVMERDDERGAFEAEIQKGAAALIPFVERWNLNLNPEQLDEMAYAVLRNAFREGEGQEVYALIAKAVNQQLDEFNERWEVD